MEAPPAVWTVVRGADEDEVERLLQALAAYLDIEAPGITRGQILLPADFPQVWEALNEVDPNWGELLVPPEP